MRAVRGATCAIAQLSISPRRQLANGIRSQGCRVRATLSKSAGFAQTRAHPHVCGVEAEPLHRYRPGGYHPVHLGDLLQDGRYRILHKLGWGGYATLWAAWDERDRKYVAVKISVADRGIQGPNGRHICIALDLVGPDIPEAIEGRFPDDRLSGKLAKSIAKQALLALDCLHQRGITHGDLYTRNLALVVPELHTISQDIYQRKRTVELGPVTHKDDQPLEPNLPTYLVYPTSYPIKPSLVQPTIKVIDFGKSFLDGERGPHELHTPLVVRPPEAFFEDPIDHRAGLRCMLFELITGQPPFDGFSLDPPSLLKQWGNMVSDPVPERWREAWRAKIGDETAILAPGDGLQSWLAEVYFAEDREQDLSRYEVRKAGDLIHRLLRLEPGSRAAASEILQDSWFDGV